MTLPSKRSQNSTKLTENEIRLWLSGAIAQKLGIDIGEIHTDIPFDEYGLDSVAAVSISGALGELLDCDFPGTLLYEYSTIDELSVHLAQITT